MAVYGKWSRFLTGERLLNYQRNLTMDAIIAILLGITVALLNYHSEYTKKLALGWGFFIVVILIVTMSLYRFLKKQTVFQLRQKELANGKTEAQKILEDAGITNGKK